MRVVFVRIRAVGIPFYIPLQSTRRAGVFNYTGACGEVVGLHYTTPSIILVVDVYLRDVCWCYIYT